MTYIGDANDPKTIRDDADTFFSSHFAPSDADEVTWVNSQFDGRVFPDYWFLDRMISGLIQVYDLVAPLDSDQAATYLFRLGAFANALLANRDDHKHPPREDPFRGRVMPAWGGLTPDRDGGWNTDVVTSGMSLYAMAAFARRVAEQPHRYPHLQDQAITLITAVMETYEAFRPELHLFDNDPHAYYVNPWSYRNLHCENMDDNTFNRCEGYRNKAGQPIDYNENLSMMRALAELALASDSNLYRASAYATPDRLQLATVEAPLVIAKNVAYRADDLRPMTLSDGTPYYDWHTSGTGGPAEDIHHAQFELGCLAVVLDAQVRLNALLKRSGRVERVPLKPSMFVRFANTFLRKVWRHNVLSEKIDGSGDEGFNDECAGWVPLAQFDPWVWTRSRDTTFQSTTPTQTDPPSLRVDNYGALLRYRRFHFMKYLTDFAGQNWLITPAALAAGESPPETISEQKWLLVLSGVVFANLKGDNSGQWNHLTVSFIPDMAGMDDPTSVSGPLNFAINKYSIPKPPGSAGAQYVIRFSVEEWAPFISLGSELNLGPSINSGFAVDDWRPNHFDSGTDVITNQPVNNIFTGVNADLAVSDSDAWIYRLGYNITLLGRIVFIAPPVIE